MPRASCPKCKYTFTPKDPNRKTVDCPDCGGRVVLNGSEPPPPPSKKRRADEAPVKKSGGVPMLLVVGGLLFVLFGLAAAGGAVWYFGFRKADKTKEAEAQAQANANAIINADKLAADNKANVPQTNRDPENKSEPKTKSPVKRLKAAAAPKMEGNEVFKLLAPSTVMILTDKGSLGSGVLIAKDPNLILTNHHVVGEHGTVRVFFPEFDAKGQVIRSLSFYTDNRSKLGQRGRVLDRDPQKDVALVEVGGVPEKAEPVPLAKESAKELDRVVGIGHSSADLNSLWQSHEGSVRQVLPPTKAFGRLHCRLLVTQQPTFHGDSGGPIVSNNLELVAIVQGGMPVEADLGRDNKGKPVISVEGREGMALTSTSRKSAISSTRPTSSTSQGNSRKPLRSTNSVSPLPRMRTSRRRITFRSSATAIRPRPALPWIG